MKVFNWNLFYYFDYLKKYILVLKLRKEFLNELWLNLNNRIIYVVIFKSMGSKDFSLELKLEIFEIYLR